MDLYYGSVVLVNTSRQPTKIFPPLKAVSLSTFAFLAGSAIFVAITFAALTKPLAFRIYNVIAPLKSEAGFAEPVGENDLDVASLIGSVSLHPQAIYDVEPKQRYHSTMIEGLGNCSNIAFGLAYHLGQLGYDYQVVFYLYPSGYLIGKGHAVVNTNFRIEGTQARGLIDIPSGGIPMLGGRLLGVNDLRTGDLDQVAIRPFNPIWDSQATSYAKIPEKFFPGVMRSVDCQRYFAFIKGIYLPFGNRRAEKYLYEAIALLLGQYPRIYMMASDIPILFSGRVAEPMLARLGLWYLRIYLVGLFLLVTWMLISVLLRPAKIQSCQVMRPKFSIGIRPMQPPPKSHPGLLGRGKSCVSSER